MDTSIIKYDYDKVKKFLFGLFSDIHIDEENFNKELFIEHIGSVCNNNGHCFFNGDIGNFITKNDRKRYVRSRDKSQSDSQILSQIDYIVSILKPYADYIDFMGMGNHEVSVIKYNSVNPLFMIAKDLMQFRSKTLPRIMLGDYQGFINLWFHRGDKRDIKRYEIYRHHGLGGLSPVTKGMIDFSRLNIGFLADCYWIGHKHNQFVDESHHRYSINPVGTVEKKKITNIITAGYETGFKPRSNNESFKEYDIKKDDYKVSFVEENFYSCYGNGYVKLELDLLSRKITSNAYSIKE